MCIIFLMRVRDLIVRLRYKGEDCAQYVFKVWWVQVHICSLLFLFRFEDGTLPFLDIVALRHGFSALQRLAIAIIDEQL